MGWIAWLLAGCQADVAIDGGCAPAGDNALRARCGFEVDPPSPVELRLETPGEPPVVRTVPADEAAEIPVWRLLPDTTYRWTARAGSTAEVGGSFVTGPLPREADLRIERTGAAPTEDLMVAADCGMDGVDPMAVVLDPDGRVVWYQPLAADLPEGDHRVVGLVWSEDRTVLAVVGRERVREFALDGTLLLDLGPEHGIAEVVHHDVFRRNGRTWVVSARRIEEAGEDYIVDGVYAFEADGSLRFDWDLTAIAAPSGEGGPGIVYWGDRFPGAADWAHVNGLYVDEDEDFVLSLHSFSTVLRIEGDPDDPAFGTPVWVLDGSGTSPWPSTFAVTDPDGVTDDDVFGNQHHPSLLPDGDLLLFDNGETLTAEARALRLRLDPAAGVAEIRGSWPIGQVCPIDGGAYVGAAGTVIATCAARATFHELDPAGPALGSTTVSCPGNEILVVPRAIPLEL